MKNSELEFLPAALEIQETPPLPVSRYILWSIMLFFSIAVAWASIGEVDIVGIAHGKIVPTGRVKIIQPLETGVIRNIFVKEGDNVEQGQPLIELDTTLTGADREQIKEQQQSLILDRTRLQTILTVINQNQTANDQEQMTNNPGPTTNDKENLQQERIRIQLNEYYARKQALMDEKNQRLAERNSVIQRIEQLTAIIPLITERAKSLEDLLKDNMAPRAQWLELEQERIEQVKERDVQRSNLVSLDAGMANITQRQAVQKAEFEKQLLAELADTENRITAFEQELVKAEKRVTLQTLNAPVSGTIHQLTMHTIGGVVTPAQELMHIIPEEDAIEVEAWLQNKDIGFVNKGQVAEIKVETFPFTKYGTIDGEITTLSNDATPDERLGLVYATRVKMMQTTIQVKDKAINLTPGMAVTVELNMGKRRLIEFLMSPLLRYKDESVRER